MQDAATDPLAEFRRVNVWGTLHLARQAAAAGVTRFIFLSSVKVNGEATHAPHPRPLPRGAREKFSEDDVPVDVSQRTDNPRELAMELVGV